MTSPPTPLSNVERGNLDATNHISTIVNNWYYDVCICLVFVGTWRAASEMPVFVAFMSVGTHRVSPKHAL